MSILSDFIEQQLDLDDAANVTNIILQYEVEIVDELQRRYPNMRSDNLTSMVHVMARTWADLKLEEFESWLSG